MIEGATLYQIGVVVRQLEAGMDHYRRLFGLGPWRRLDTDYMAKFRDWTGRVANRNAFARWGDLYLEMVEPGLGRSSAREWLDTRGEGIFHLGYVVDGPPAAPSGAAICFETLDTRIEGRPAIIHLDTVDALGYFVELAERGLCDRLMRWIDTPDDGAGTV